MTLLVLLLTACGTTAVETKPSASTQEAAAIPDLATPVPDNSNAQVSPVLSTTYVNAVSVPMQLMIGILQLENTDLAVTSTQAASLLPLLTFARDLITGNSVTQEQIDSLTQQVQSILSADQIQAIANMQITQQTAMSLIQQEGNTKSDPSQGNGNPPPQGDLPQGTPPAGGPQGQPPSRDAMGAPPADGTQPNMGFVLPPLIDKLIQLMQNKTTSS